MIKQPGLKTTQTMTAHLNSQFVASSQSRFEYSKRPEYIPEDPREEPKGLLKFVFKDVPKWTMWSPKIEDPLGKCAFKDAHSTAASLFIIHR